MEQNKPNNLIPFGKYKGQPVEVLINDKKYLEWLQQQDWFRSQYATINTLIINNFQEASETPEHNKIQALFTDDEFCIKFYNALANKHRFFKKRGFEETVYVHPETGIWYSGSDRCLLPGITKSEYNGATLKYENCDWFYQERIGNQTWEKSEKIYLKKEQIKIPVQDTTLEFEIRYEIKGADVEFKVEEAVCGFPLSVTDELYYNSRYLGEQLIEIKPTVSDDYPATLRQMKSNKSRILLTEKYTGTGATYEQVCKIFDASLIDIILLSDVLHAKGD